MVAAALPHNTSLPRKSHGCKKRGSRAPMNKHKYRLIEERLERIKYFGSLQLQELERFYNGDSIIRKYDGAGKFVCHVHCLWHEDALAKWRLCLEVTGPVHE